MMKNIIIFILTSILLSCGEEELPEPTQSGNNTFGCKIDGEVFVPRSSDFKDSPIFASIANNRFVVSGSFSKSSIFKQVAMAVNFYGKSTYLLNEIKQPTNNYGFYVFRNNNSNKVEYCTNSLQTGNLKITYFSSREKIISGTFSFKAESPDENVVVITDRRFDIKYRDY